MYMDNVNIAIKELKLEKSTKLQGEQVGKKLVKL